MIVAFDNSFLCLVLRPGSRPTPNPATGKPVEHCRERIEALVDQLGRNGGSVLIPTPCLTELLSRVPDLEKALTEINRSSAFQIAPFDTRCAIELADITRRALAKDDKKSGATASWNEVKFDRQIAAIAKIYGAGTLYTDDGNQTLFAEEIGLKVLHTWDLELPAEYAQTRLDLDKNS